MMVVAAPFDRWLIAGCVIDGAGLGLLLILMDPLTGLLDWVLIYLVLLGFGLAMIGLMLLLIHMLPSALAGMMVTLLAVAWLSWPIWMAPRMEWVERHIHTLVSVHPLLTINARIDHEGLWTHRTLSYRLMNLGQDYPYRLPSGIWPSAIVHAAIGLVLLMMGGFMERSASSLTTRLPETKSPEASHGSAGP